MSRTWSRRRFLAVLPVAALAGCTGSGGAGEPAGEGTTTTAAGDTTTSAAQPTQAPTATETPSPTDTPTPSATSTPTTTMEPQDQIDRLPEPSPLTNVLQDLVLADDRQQFATKSEIPYRDGAVKVELELVEDGEPPRDLLGEIQTEYGTLVIAWVRVENLVDVALAEDVRLVRRHARPKTH